MEAISWQAGGSVWVRSWKMDPWTIMCHPYVTATVWCAVKGRVDTDVDWRHTTDTWRPHHQVADDERFTVCEAVREGDERLGSKAHEYAAHHWQLAQGGISSSSSSSSLLWNQTVLSWTECHLRWLPQACARSICPLENVLCWLFVEGMIQCV